MAWPCEGLGVWVVREGDGKDDGNMKDDVVSNMTVSFAKLKYDHSNECGTSPQFPKSSARASLT